MSIPDFLQGGGEMGERTRAYDWASSPVGAPEQWPKSLQTVVATLLSSRFPMFLWWGADLIQFYNDAYRPSMGNDGKHPQALGQKGKDCWPEIWDIIYPLIFRVLTTGQSTWSEDQLVPIYRDGAIQDVYWTFSYSPIRDDQGVITGVLVICTETTEKVAYLRQLSDSKKELEFAIDSADLGTWDLNPATNKFTANARLKEWFGLQPAEEIDLTKAIDSMHEDDRERVVEAIQYALDPVSGGYYDIDYRIVNPNSGFQRIVHAKGKAIFDDQQNPVRFNGILQDITDQKHAEATERLARQKIEESEKNFRNTILKAPVAISILRGPEYVIEIVNDRMLELWGAASDAVLHKPLFEALPEVRDQGFERLLHQVYHTGASVAIQEYPVQLLRNGKLEQEFVSFLYESEIGTGGQITGVIAVALLVTAQVIARRQIEDVVTERTRELAEANRHLERSNADLRQFAHVASHDLQEPVRKIATYASLLETCTIEGPAENFLQKITTAAARMKALIRDVLVYSEVSDQDALFEPVNLQTTVKELQSEFELLISQKGVRLEYHDLPIVQGIPLQMSQLFGNLLSNALKYTNPDVPPVIVISCEQEGKYFHLRFRDNGIGFEPQFAEHIFRIFQRLHRKSEFSGTGIGLAICKKIVENHYGEIYATSIPGQGATFHVLLPTGQA